MHIYIYIHIHMYIHIYVCIWSPLEALRFSACEISSASVRIELSQSGIALAQGACASHGARRA